MMSAMYAVATSNSELSVEERNLLLDAYKIVMKGKRNSLKTILSIETKEENKGGNSSKLRYIKTYRNQVEKEFKDICEVCR